MREQATEKPSLREIIGVTERSHERWLDECSAALARMRDTSDVIFQRELREGSDALCSAVGAVIENCRHDPDDIRKELALPTILRNAAGILEDFVQIMCDTEAGPELSGQLRAAMEMVHDGTPRLQALLERMRNSDHEDFVERAKVVSSIFQRMPEGARSAKSSP